MGLFIFFSRTQLSTYLVKEEQVRLHAHPNPEAAQAAEFNSFYFLIHKNNRKATWT
jgi:hypothetical protein